MRSSVSIFLISCSLNTATAFATNTSLVSGDDTQKERAVENAALNFRLIPRTPAQMAAFYEGRGFPGAALEQKVMGVLLFLLLII